METLESIAINIKTEVGQYDADVFAEHIVSIIRELTAPWNQSVIQGMVSPLKQLLYLLNLNLTSGEQATKKTFLDDSDWTRLVTLLNKMDSIHQKDWGEFKPFDENLSNELDEDELLRRRLIGVSTYNAFFHQGPLHFEEQTIEKITEVLKNFNVELKTEFGWDSTDFVVLYNYLDDLQQAKTDKGMMKKEPKPEPTAEEFKANVMEALRNSKSFEEAMMQAAPFDMDMMEYRANPSASSSFELEDLKNFSIAISSALLDNFLVERVADDSFLYFSHANQILKRPIYKLTTGKYLVIDYKLLLSAMFSFLLQKSASIIKKTNRITSARDKYLENKVQDLFTNFYKKDKKAKIFPSYYLDGSERDLLVLSKDTVLIVESKAGNVREPMFDPDKAYKKILSDFEETIGYGYEQAYSVKEKFMAEVPFDINDDKGKVIHSINPRHYKNVFNIVITYNKFGHVQSDLWLMLDIFDEDEQYPWSVCVDDLEVFLLCMQKLNFTIADFSRFLRLREHLHGNLVVNDEGRVMGHFLTNKRFLPAQGTYRFPASDDLIIDRLYSTGLGFKNEKRLEMKKNVRITKLY
jgi:hypothetical protein